MSQITDIIEKRLHLLCQCFKWTTMLLCNAPLKNLRLLPLLLFNRGEQSETGSENVADVVGVIRHLHDKAQPYDSQKMGK